ncbi:transmembrane protein 200C [Brachionichthys hirsutus]|uniref:transmembrane protein 200C n=1 Tax=Brachionichthys hirsutus TaxID=412623 RepID=UPI00360466E4
MIATGGLLRINARRQDSLRSKARTQKRKSKKKRRSEVVVVKGKLNLVSVSGLVAAFGILVLLVGLGMAALGYWPREGLLLPPQPKEGATMASKSSRSSALVPADAQGGERQEGNEEGDRGGGEGGGGGGGGGADGFNQTETVNRTAQPPPHGFLKHFLDRYLYSDRLKVFGPLTMGIGIFLFICANAVLHENRDKKTKVINLRDIYSTVIDLHGLHKANGASGPRSSANPLSGLVNYVQSKSLETKPRAYPASLMSRREGGGGGGGGGGVEAGVGLLSRQLLPGISGGGRGGGDEGEGRETVFSIYQEPEAPPPRSSSHSLSLLPSFTPPDLSTCWSSLQKEALSYCTLPLRRQRLPAPRRRHSARGGMDWATGGAEERWTERRSPSQEEEEEDGNACLPTPLSSSTPPPVRRCSFSSLHREAPEGSQALLLLSSSSLSPSHQSLSSLSHLLSSSSSTLPPPCRRRSLPATCSMTGYSKLVHAEAESFESAEMTSSHHVTSDRKYSNREKLRMISQAGGEGGGLMKQHGQSETSFAQL